MGLIRHRDIGQIGQSPVVFVVGTGYIILLSPVCQPSA